MSKVLAFNWKMNPAKLNEALELARISDAPQVIVIPPFVFLEEVKKILKKASLGAQDLFWQNPSVEGGAFTGEVSGEELKNLGVAYAIIGHSERRQKLGETDAIVAKKLKTALEIGLIPIFCVGETAAEKERGERDEVLKRQIEIGLAIAESDSRFHHAQILLAYEPVWAIGSGNPETPESAAATISALREIIATHPFKMTFLYGGSVNSQNLKNYLNYKEIDGVLVGGASLQKEEIKQMITNLN